MKKTTCTALAGTGSQVRERHEAQLRKRQPCLGKAANMHAIPKLMCRCWSPVQAVPRFGGVVRLDQRQTRSCRIHRATQIIMFPTTGHPKPNITTGDDTKEK
jgi:hypothetical protein